MPLMKSITVYFEDSQFKVLSRQKSELTWKKFILNLAERDRKKSLNK